MRRMGKGKNTDQLATTCGGSGSGASDAPELDAGPRRDFAPLEIVHVQKFK